MKYATETGQMAVTSEVELGSGDYYVSKWLDIRPLEVAMGLEPQASTAGVDGEEVCQPDRDESTKAYQFAGDGESKEIIVVWTEKSRETVGDIFRAATGHCPEQEEVVYSCAVPEIAGLHLVTPGEEVPVPKVPDDCLCAVQHRHESDSDHDDYDDPELSSTLDPDRDMVLD